MCSPAATCSPTRYALGWIFIAFLAILGAALLQLVEPVASAFGMSPTGVLLGVMALAFLLITMQLTIAASAQRARMRELAESHALLQHELEELRERSG